MGWFILAIWERKFTVSISNKRNEKCLIQSKTKLKGKCDEIIFNWLFGHFSTCGKRARGTDSAGSNTRPGPFYTSKQKSKSGHFGSKRHSIERFPPGFAGLGLSISHQTDCYSNRCQFRFECHVDGLAGSRKNQQQRQSRGVYPKGFSFLGKETGNERRRHAGYLPVF